MASTKGQKGSATVDPAMYSTDKKLFATRYKQGGRTVYGVAMTPAQIAATVKKPEPGKFNSGNRVIRKKHAEEFGEYVREYREWVSPGIILRAPNIFSFDASEQVADVQFGVLSYPERQQGDIQILDGQHRILGFHVALETLDEALDAARANLSASRRVGEGEKEVRAEIERLEAVRDRMYTERVSVEIQVTDDLKVWRQMFADIADNMLGINAAVRARFDMRKVVNRAYARLVDHPLLVDKIDQENARVARNSPYWLSASHITDLNRILAVGLEGRIAARKERELDDRAVAQTTKDFLGVITHSFPIIAAMERGEVTAQGVRASSMVGSPNFIRILAGVYHELVVQHAWARKDVEDYFKAIEQHTNTPAHANSIWRRHLSETVFEEGTWGPSARRQDSKEILVKMTAWALDHDPLVYAEPEPAPEPILEPERTDDEILAEINAKKDVPEVRVAVEDMVAEVAAESKARGRARSTVKKK